MSLVEKTKSIRCDECGRFVSYYSNVLIEYTPDSEFTVETIEHTCEQCLWMRDPEGVMKA